TLRITDSWVLYARRRSDNFCVVDLQRLKSAVQETPLGEVPAAVQRLVTKLPDTKVYRPTLLNFGGHYGGNTAGVGSRRDTPRPIDATAFEEEDLTDTHDLFFPKEFNEAQIAIVRRLEGADGVVVQGPPGTGN